MSELELTRAGDDRRTYVLEGVGSLRLEGWSGRRAVIEAGGRRLEAARAGFWQRRIEATDSAGTVAATFAPRSVRRGGELDVGGRALALAPASTFRERYVLVEGERELASFDARSWGKRTVTVTLAEPGALEAWLVLFCAFVARSLADDASSSAGGASAAAIG